MFGLTAKAAVDALLLRLVQTMPAVHKTIDATNDTIDTKITLFHRRRVSLSPPVRIPAGSKGPHESSIAYDIEIRKSFLERTLKEILFDEDSGERVVW